MVPRRTVASIGRDAQRTGCRARRWSFPRYSNGVHIEMSRSKNRPDRNSVLLIIVCAVLAVIFATPSVAVAENQKGKSESNEKVEKAELPLRWKVWLEEEVYPLISTEQRKAFLRLETEAQRKAFVERIWNLWSRQSGFGSAFRRMYEDRLAMVRYEYGNTIEDRARVILIHGPPAGRFDPRCHSMFQPMEFWIWPYIEGLGEDVIVLFFRRDTLTHWRLWTKFEGQTVLYNTWGAASQGAPSTGNPRDLNNPIYRCPNGDQTLRMLAAVTAWSNDSTYMRSMYRFLNFDRGGGPESTSHRFMEFSALLDKKAEPLDFSVSSEMSAARGGLVEVSIGIDVDVDGLGTNAVGDVEVIQLDVVGEITSAGEVMVDRFRYLFSVPQAEEQVGLKLDRLIRPGNYNLRVKVEDVHSKHAAVAEQQLITTAHGRRSELFRRGPRSLC